MSTTGPPPPTGPRALPNTTLQAIRARFHSLDRRIKYLEKNRTPAPTPMSNVSDAPVMQMAEAGHAPTMDPNPAATLGQFQPQVVLATLLFHMPGSLTTATSPPLHSRYIANIVGVSADLGFFDSDVTFDILVNGSSIATILVTEASTGYLEVASTPLNPYTDLVTIETTSIGTGNEELVVHVELSVDVNNPPNPP